MLYREDIDRIKHRLEYIAGYLRAIDAARSHPTLRERTEAEHPSHHRWSKPYETLERVVAQLAMTRNFYPTREDMRTSAYTFTRDPGSGAYRYAH